MIIHFCCFYPHRYSVQTWWAHCPQQLGPLQKRHGCHLPHAGHRPHPGPGQPRALQRLGCCVRRRAHQQRETLLGGDGQKVPRVSPGRCRGPDVQTRLRGHQQLLLGVRLRSAEVVCHDQQKDGPGDTGGEAGARRNPAGLWSRPPGAGGRGEPSDRLRTQGSVHCSSLPCIWTLGRGAAHSHRLRGAWRPQMNLSTVMIFGASKWI